MPSEGASQLLPYSALSQLLTCRTAKLRIEFKKTFSVLLPSKTTTIIE